MFDAIARESQIRGLHAFGAAWYATGQASSELVCKKHLSLDGLLADVPRELPGRFIFHARYSTSGDYRELSNNQPIVRDGAALAFNGTLDMGTKVEMERRHSVELLTDNDGELALLAALKGADALKTFVAGTRGSIASVSLVGGKLWAIRNARRPMWSLYIPGGKFFASTRDIFKRATGMDAVPVPPNELLEF